MSDSFKRRRRTGSTSARYRPSPLVSVESAGSARIGKTQLAACGAVGIVVVTLTALIWMVTNHTVQEQRVEVRDRAEQALLAQATTMAETVAHELLLIDQSLTIIQAAWKIDSDSVDLDKLRQNMPALMEVADDLFISDEQHVIRQDILPQAIGQGVGAAYVTFPHGSLEQYETDGTKSKESLLLQRNTGVSIDARQFLMYIVRPLDHPNGWLIGASYRSAELTKLFAQSALGYNPVVALVDTQRGVLQAIVGPAARHPKTDLSQGPLFGIMTRSPAGTWLGDTAIDGVERIHAFHRVGNRNMVVLVAANWAEVMAPADNLAAGARSLACVATGLVGGIGGLVLWGLSTVRASRRKKRVFDRNKTELERLRTDAIVTIARSQLNAARLQALIDNVPDGIALFDSGGRLVQWNHSFLYNIGIDPRKDMPLDTLLREQAATGMFAPPAEAEIARRVRILQAADPVGVSQSGPDHQSLTLRGVRVSEGGFILLLQGAIDQQPPPSSLTRIHEAADPEPAAPAPIEW